jgi:hypothetical protein
MPYVRPEDVRAPRESWRLSEVLIDRGKNSNRYSSEAWALVCGRWCGVPCLGIRLNGSDASPPKRRLSPAGACTECGERDADFVVTGGERRRQKVRGRNRITGNRSVRSRPLAPSPPPTRIAIASDAPRGAASW